MAQRGEFAEWAEVHGHLYGTHWGTLNRTLDEGIDVLLDVDAQGAALLRKQFQEGVFIYILPPSLGALKQRLFERGLDSPEEIQRRLKESRREIQDLDQYSYLIVNDDFKKAGRELVAVIIAERIRLRLPETELIKENFLKN